MDGTLATGVGATVRAVYDDGTLQPYQAQLTVEPDHGPYLTTTWSFRKVVVLELTSVATTKASPERPCCCLGDRMEKSTRRMPAPNHAPA